ncbi:ABC transporter permease [Amphritea pacifica]|uniref:ABC transporter permease subunit n=1 Tax=Amphritea pacifica TaxID=2811233 RepID=A0ABS2W7Y8_9GAMM|nr:ABC transporter permease subunit [Amphritea pacifica]MBN0987804.1 ABC transporter permease subunit [Amphritea pacifica]MBN1008081.1 ABC transporter permease subunit [Amphritea pacifica]
MIKAMRFAMHTPWLVFVLLVLVLFAISSNSVSLFGTNLRSIPEFMILPLSDWAGNALNWFAREASIGSLTVQTITRNFAELVNWPITALNMLLADGIVTGAGFNKHQLMPPLSWLGLSSALVLYSYFLGGRRLAWLSAIGTAYLVFFGLWQHAMTTLASVIMCVIVAAGLGLFIGIASYRAEKVEIASRVVMNVMQTVPIFSYLVPTLLLFGYGPSAALLATVLYALPPMVHATVLALKSVPTEIREYGEIAGSTKRQLLWKVELPAALPMLTVGLNQVVMMSLNMVIIASMIGAGGLGYDVLRALRRLDIGGGLEAGMGIVVLAVILDRITQAAARRQSAGLNHEVRSPRPWLYLLIIFGATGASFLLPALQFWPEKMMLSTAPFWNESISFINQHFFDQMEALRNFSLLHIMNPFRDFLVELPFVLVLLTLGGIAYVLSGIRLAAIVMGMTAFIAVSGFWEAAMISVYLTACSVVIAVLIGFPFGVYIASSPRLLKPASLLLDTLQTLPTFIYLLPAVMLFRNGDFSALIAIACYAIAPAIRYTIHGLRSVPESRIEAAIMAGCTPTQVFRHVKIPSAYPTLLLGLNQTIMMALSMLVIAALVGTRDLGQEVYIALTRAETGNGIIAGLGIAAIALISDSLLKAWAAKKQHQLGVKP